MNKKRAFTATIQLQENTVLEIINNAINVLLVIGILRAEIK
jgi:uncharacterized membrane protein